MRGLLGVGPRGSPDGGFVTATRCPLSGAGLSPICDGFPPILAWSIFAGFFWSVAAWVFPVLCKSRMLDRCYWPSVGEFVHSCTVRSLYGSCHDRTDRRDG